MFMKKIISTILALVMTVSLFNILCFDSVAAECFAISDTVEVKSQNTDWSGQSNINTDTIEEFDMSDGRYKAIKLVLYGTQFWK